nr:MULTISPECIES: hypothetical protein [unclassified Brucella]
MKANRSVRLSSTDERKPSPLRRPGFRARPWNLADRATCKILCFVRLCCDFGRIS